MDRFERALVVGIFGFLFTVLILLFAQHQLDAARYYECAANSHAPYAETKVLCQRPRN
jgi:hypothetical protein